jgi:uncharacterized membrane protein
MSDLYFIIFELIIYLQFALCLLHARQHGVQGILRLLSGVAFGLLLELATISQLGAYQYGHFLIMIGAVPLCIGVAWGSIIFSVMEFSDATTLPRWARPLLDGLLALNIDLALDTVAIRLGFWSWGRPFTFQFFGVPFANYLAWFWVAASFSAGYRLLAYNRSRSLSLLAGPLGILVGLLVVIATNAAMAFAIPIYQHIYLAVLIPIMAIIIVLSRQPALRERQMPAMATVVPLLTFIYLLAAGFISGIFIESPDLLIINLAMLSVLLWVHWPAIRHWLAFKPRMRQSHSQ